MRLVCISDTHDMQPLVSGLIPDGDVLIHAGDLTKNGTFGEINRVGQELAALAHKKKLVIAGNHDKLFEKDCLLAKMALGDGYHGVRYIQDDLFPYRGVQFYGSPWTPRFYDWAFQLDTQRPESQRPFLLGPTAPRIASEHWARVPTGVDVLITHGPPRSILDLVHHGNRVGDPDLLAAVDRLRPKLHVFGHIHSSPGVVEQDGTVYVNACLCDEAYRMKHKPVVLDYEEGKVTVVSR